VHASTRATARAAGIRRPSHHALGATASPSTRKLGGATYEEISRAGGGIRSTVAAVRAASEATLVEQTLPRVRALMHEGVTCLEIKSGYGLSFDAELKMLRAIRLLASRVPIRLVPTFLGAHAVPAEQQKAPTPTMCRPHVARRCE
jgi:imidazolonepropionase